MKSKVLILLNILVLIGLSLWVIVAVKDRAKPYNCDMRFIPQVDDYNKEYVINNKTPIVCQCSSSEIEGMISCRIDQKIEEVKPAFRYRRDIYDN